MAEKEQMETTQGINNNITNNRLTEWINESVKTISSNAHASPNDHIDWFLDKNNMKNNRESLPAAVSVFLRCIELVKALKVDSQVKVSLSVPFTWSDGIVMFDGHYYFQKEEPPSIYLHHKLAYMETYHADLYRKTIPTFDERLNSKYFHTFYQCWRYHSCPHKYHEDYMRSITVQHYWEIL